MLKKILNKILSYFTTFFYKTRLVLSKRSFIYAPLKLDGIKNFKIGNHVTVHYKSWLAAMPLTGEKPELIIDDKATIGHFAHIYATKSIHIGKNVLIADRVYISDNLHGYEDISLSIMEQNIIQKRTVSIGDESWIGENVCIIGASVGKHCVIGANSVVTKDIPDYTVAVGNPAKVIKQYDFEKDTWVRC